MATIAENLQTARENIAAKLAEISADPKPTYTDGSRTVSWESFFKMLTDQMEALDKRLAASQPVEVITTVRPW